MKEREKKGARQETIHLSLVLLILVCVQRCRTFARSPRPKPKCLPRWERTVTRSPPTERTGNNGPGTCSRRFESLCTFSFFFFVVASSCTSSPSPAYRHMHFILAFRLCVSSLLFYILKIFCCVYVHIFAPFQFEYISGS